MSAELVARARGELEEMFSSVPEAERPRLGAVLAYFLAGGGHVRNVGMSINQTDAAAEAALDFLDWWRSQGATVPDAPREDNLTEPGAVVEAPETATEPLGADSAGTAPDPFGTLQAGVGRATAASSVQQACEGHPGEALGRLVESTQGETRGCLECGSSFRVNPCHAEAHRFC